MAPIKMYQTGKDDGLKGIGDLPWERLLAVLDVGQKTATKIAKEMVGMAPARTFIELRQKNVTKRRVSVFFKEEGKVSGIPEDALLEALQPPARGEAMRRKAVNETRAAKEKGEKKAAGKLKVAPPAKKPKGGEVHHAAAS